jgi:serine/threonine protein kinase
MFGTGMLAYDTSKDNMPVCVKLFKGLDKAVAESFDVELNAGKAQLHHSNVLRLLGAGKSQICKDGVPSGPETLFIVSELAANGEAFDYVEMAEGLDPEYARQMFTQLLGAVAFIHGKGMVHRDLKLENCFLDKNV